MLCPHQGERIVVISSVRCVSAVLFTLPRDFFGEIIKTAGPMQHQNLFYLFLFIFVFSTRLVAMAIPRIIYSDREFSLYSEMVSILLVLLDSLVAV